MTVGCDTKNIPNNSPINPTDATKNNSQEQEYNVSQEKEMEVAQKEIEQAEIIELREMQITEFSEGGKIFVDIPEKDIKSFQDKVTMITIPDARKGERAANILDEGRNKGLVFLKSIPEKNIYLMGIMMKSFLGSALFWIWV